MAMFDFRQTGLLVILMAFGISSPTMAISDLERTWVHARVAMAGEKSGKTHYFQLDSREGGLRLGDYQGLKRPIVVYLHGCTGFSGRDKKAIRKIAAAGFIVVAPDSMARRYRPRQCSSRQQKGGNNHFVFDFRQAEINFALDNLWEKPWVDWDNMFLMGVSEGGLATAHYRGVYFRARIITQWTCHGDPLVRGISAKADEPILAVVQAEDPWYNGAGSKQSGDCGAFFENRPGSRSVVLRDGKEHNVMANPEIIGQIIDFLKENIRTKGAN